MFLVQINKGSFETLTHEAINKPTTERHLGTALIS
jgi:hypothetical protein